MMTPEPGEGLLSFLRRAAVATGMTWGNLADRADILQSTLHQWIAEQRCIPKTWESLHKLVVVLDVHPNDVYQLWLAERTRNPVFPGDEFGHWTVLEIVWVQWKRQRDQAAICRCSCGVERRVPLTILHSGRSAGCWGKRCKKEVAPHGTYPGYVYHRRHHTTPCDPCVKAWTEYSRPYVARYRAAA